MTDWQLNTPVVLIIFKRKDTTARVFESIRAARPSTLLIVADGPRADIVGEEAQCMATREVVDKVDWECKVFKNYASQNMGCKDRVSSGLDWVFQQVEEAIILEDDCLPHPHFFRFCDEMLKLYRNDTRIMAVAGTNAFGKWRTNQSYHFSYSGGVWGWASWRRAWNYYDVNLTHWRDPVAQQHIRDVICDEKQFQWRSHIFNAMLDGSIDTWDYQWLVARLLQAGLTTIPAVNLISNIGFRSDATHTKVSQSPLANLATYSMQFPIDKNMFVGVDREYDRKLMELAWSSSFRERMSSRFRRVAKKLAISGN